MFSESKVTSYRVMDHLVSIDNYNLGMDPKTNEQRTLGGCETSQS